MGAKPQREAHRRHDQLLQNFGLCRQLCGLYLQKRRGLEMVAAEAIQVVGWELHPNQ